jgi:hypothetical protein
MGETIINSTLCKNAHGFWASSTTYHAIVTRLSRRHHIFVTPGSYTEPIMKITKHLKITLLAGTALLLSGVLVGCGGGGGNNTSNNGNNNNTNTSTNGKRSVIPVTVTPPTGWTVNKFDKNTTILVKQDVGVIAISTGIYDNITAATAPLVTLTQQLGQDATLRLLSERDTTFVGRTGYVAHLTLQNTTGLAHLHLAAVAPTNATQEKLGAYVVGIGTVATQVEIEAAVKNTVEAFRYAAVQENQSARNTLTGTWSRAGGGLSNTSVNGTGSVNTSNSYTFNSNGTFTSVSKSIISISVPGSSSTGSGLSLFDDSGSGTDSGRFLVIGDQLVIASATGGTTELDFSLSGNKLVLQGTGALTKQ